MEWKALCGATGYIETEGALLATYHLSEKEIVLFDSGVEKSEALFDLLDALGVRVRAVLSTHLHIDHIANNEELVERYGAEVFAHEEEIKVLHIRREVNYPITKVDPEQPVTIDGAVFRVVPTLGHSEGHLAYITPDNVCVVGDALLSQEKLNQSKMPYMEDVDHAILSMEALRETSCEQYILSHNGVVPRAELSALIDENIRKELDLYDALRSCLTEPLEMDSAINRYLNAIDIRNPKVMELGYVRWTARTRICALVSAGEFCVEGEHVFPCQHTAMRETEMEREQASRSRCLLCGLPADTNEKEYSAKRERRNTMDMYEQIKGLEPQNVLRCFWDLSRVPRPSGYRQPVSNFVADYARALGLEVHQDAAWNVIVRKPGSKGSENAPPVMLQAHLDMVGEKVPGNPHDFSKDPIKLVIDGDKVTADGTTLGADDGIGVALMMAILADDTLRHPPIEAVFTTDEETDMSGAMALDFSQFKSKTILNLDSSPVEVCGAGELSFVVRFTCERTALQAGYGVYALSVSGLQGGHSGDNAIDERASANDLAARVLCALEKELPLQILSFTGGADFSTAFAREATALLALPESDLPAAEKVVAKCLADFKHELKHRDAGVTLALTAAESELAPLGDRAAEKLLTLLSCLPDGLLALNREFPGKMETCSNVGVVKTSEEEIAIFVTMRSMIASRRYNLFNKVERLCKALGVAYTVLTDLPQWDYTASEELMALVREIYPDEEIACAQGTLEAGFFCTNMPGASFISLCPPYYNPHSPSEYFLLSECEKYYKKLLVMLERLS